VWLVLFSSSLSLLFRFFLLFFVSLLFSYPATLHYYTRMVVSFSQLFIRVCVCAWISLSLSRTVCVFKVKFELFPLVQFLFFSPNLNVLDRVNTSTNSDIHMHARPDRPTPLSLVCLSYIHTSYLFCTCALRVLLLLLLSSLFSPFFLCCYLLSWFVIIMSYSSTSPRSSLRIRHAVQYSE
jgi:hypothetical protein